MLTFSFIFLGFATMYNAFADEKVRKNMDEKAVILKTREGLAGIVTYMATRLDLFPKKLERQRVLKTEQIQEIRDIWGRYLDYQLILDAWDQGENAEEQRQQEYARFIASYAVFLTRYHYALEFIRLADTDPAVRIVLNEPVDEIGLPARSYDDFKYRFLHVVIASRFAFLSAKYSSAHSSASTSHSEEAAALGRIIRDDESYLWQAGKAHGLLNTLRNAGQIIQGSSTRLIFPVQKGISEWMGQTRVAKGDQFLMSRDQIKALHPRLQPGDILLERREWYLSNIGLPGFWPHAALYIGDEKERGAYFDTPEIRTWLQTQGIADGRFETLLKTRFPKAYPLSQQPDDKGDMPRIIEAIGKGISFTSLEHSAAADSLAVLRPRLSRLEIAKAILKSFEYSGRPYDFDFDFRTDNELVCTELVYKSYRPGKDRQGLDWPTTTVVGRPVLTANNIVRHFDETWQTPAQLVDLVAFFDGNANSGQAEESDLESFRASWRRPKWHILLQKDENDAQP
ncbi:MAG: protein tyrosine phosphatase [Betaproteobacteria bacterium]|nr:protein tyrosine phosphatase [Betaproteobacteria bacterium]